MKIILNLVILLFLMSGRAVDAQPLFQTGNPFVKSMCISPDERTIAVEGDAGEVALWDLGARKKTSTLKRRATIRNTDEENPMTGLMPFVFSAIGRSFFTPNGKHLIVCNDKGVAAWDINKPLPVIDFFADRDFYDVSKDGAFIVVVKAATANEDNNAADTGRGYSGDEIVVYDLATGSKKEIEISTTSEVKRIKIIPGTTQILVVGVEGELVVADWTTGAVTDEKSVYDGEGSYEGPGYIAEEELMFFSSMSLAIHPDKPLIAVTDQQGLLHIYNYKTHQKLHSISVSSFMDMPGLYFEYLQFSPDGKYLFGVSKALGSSSFKNVSRFWNIETGKEVKKIEAEAINSGFAFSPDKQWFVLGKMNFDKKENTTVTVFKSSNLEEVATFPGRGAFAFFSNNNKRLAYIDGAGINIFTINTTSGK